MKSDQELSQIPADDRAALREELLRTSAGDRLEVFDALNREVEEEDVPEMPESLRDRLVEQFGDRAQRRAAVVPAAPGFIASVVEFFKAKPVVGFGGLAAAACAVMFMMTQIGGVDDPERRIDHLRGGGDGKVPATAEVPVFLFPKSAAAEVVALMDKEREVVLLEDVSSLVGEVGDGWAVAADLERRVILTFEAGEPVGEVQIDGDGPSGVLLGIRAALDEMIE